MTFNYICAWENKKNRTEKKGIVYSPLFFIFSGGIYKNKVIHKSEKNNFKKFPKNGKRPYFGLISLFLVCGWFMDDLWTAYG